ncbi:MAG TPA: outer membrane lipoprotein chaperone LolA [Gammaproteobacteria bacterium]|nr:outer membrane lipoprotein chaperone LolA [Gammaproteobacteria bacterium]
MDRAKFWFRRRRATTESVTATIICLCLVPMVVEGQSDPAARAAPISLSREQWPVEFREFLETVDAFRARFVQELWSDDQRLIEVAQGTVELQRPGRFRWHYVEPYEQLIVADGENLWMYDIDIAQVTRSDLSANDSGNPAALLTGSADVEEHFDVVDARTTAEEVWIELVPKDTTSDYSAVRVGFSRSDASGVLSALEFVDGLSQTTLIRFEDAESNPDLAPEEFEFVVPDGVHVLGGTG